MSCKPYAYLSALIAALGGFLQSYAASVIAGAILFLSPEFGLSPAQEGLAAAMILIGALFGSTFASNLADRLGRKKTLLISAWLFCISNLPILFTHSFSMLLTLRFITGIAAGISSLTVPLYLAEIAPPSKRGAFVSFFQLLVTIGTLVAYFINLVLISSGNWREMLFFTVIPAIIQGIALLFVPESPKWLFGKGLVEKSAETLRSLHEENGFALQASFNELGGTWKTVLAPFFRKGIWLGVALVVFQQWCGINAIVYFAPKIFQSGTPLSRKKR